MYTRDNAPEHMRPTRAELDADEAAEQREDRAALQRVAAYLEGREQTAHSAGRAVDPVIAALWPNQSQLRHDDLRTVLALARERLNPPQRSTALDPFAEYVDVTADPQQYGPLT